MYHAVGGQGPPYLAGTIGPAERLEAGSVVGSSLLNRENGLAVARLAQGGAVGCSGAVARASRPRYALSGTAVPSVSVSSR